MEQSLYLEQAEKVLFERFTVEVEKGNLDAADKIADLLERMSLI